jgi:hypothetical protein
MALVQSTGKIYTANFDSIPHDLHRSDDGLVKRVFKYEEWTIISYSMPKSTIPRIKTLVPGCHTLIGINITTLFLHEFTTKLWIVVFQIPPNITTKPQALAMMILRSGKTLWRQRCRQAMLHPKLSRMHSLSMLKNIGFLEMTVS